MARVGVVVDVEVGGEGVEDLAGVGEVGFEGVDGGGGGVREGVEVEVEDGVAFGEEVGDHVAACFSGATGEDDTFTGGCGHIFLHA